MELKEGSAFLFKNQNQVPGDNKPHLTGRLKVNGQEYQIALWANQGRNGQAPYYSGKVQIPRAPQQSQRAHTRPPGVGYPQQPYNGPQQPPQAPYGHPAQPYRHPDPLATQLGPVGHYPPQSQPMMPPPEPHSEMPDYPDDEIPF